MSAARHSSTIFSKSPLSLLCLLLALVLALAPSQATAEGACHLQPGEEENSRLVLQMAPSVSPFFYPLGSIRGECREYYGVPTKRCGRCPFATLESWFERLSDTQYSKSGENPEDVTASPSLPTVLARYVRETLRV